MNPYLLVLYFYTDLLFSCAIRNIHSFWSEILHGHVVTSFDVTFRLEMWNFFCNFLKALRVSNLWNRTFIRKEYTCETSNCCRSFRVARRQRARFLEQKKSAVIIQKFWRGARARKLFQQETSRLILLQSQVVISMNIMMSWDVFSFAFSLKGTQA
jgi:hypothetical protein